MSSSPRWRGLALLVLLATLPVVRSTARASAAEPRINVVPTGTTTVIPDAGWSWFSDERAQFSSDGTTLYTGAVASRYAQRLPPGTSMVGEFTLATGARRLVGLGVAESDDHDNPSIYAAPNGEVTTAWSRHSRDGLIHQQRRRTDGSWLLLPSIPAGGNTTYSRLVSSTGGAGEAVLYNFYRGDRFDASALVSTDVGRSWEDIGPILRDPTDLIEGRPYVQYAADGHGRIDLIATATHPRDEQTSIYHGYIKTGQVFRSDGTLLGPLGATLPVTALTRVWSPPGSERAWLAGIQDDPITGQPTIVFSVRHSVTDHRYWYGSWDGTTWQTAEVAYAGTALTAEEEDYTGLAALDPADPTHLVISTNADPVTGAPLVSVADQQRHWELWDGRQAGGIWTWTALTRDSTTDNLRPVVAALNGARALLWMRGSYPGYTTYDTDIVGVISTPEGTTVGAGAATVATSVRVLPTPAPSTERGTPMVGQFDGHPADDLLMIHPGAVSESLFLGDEQHHPSAIAAPSVTGTYTPIAGDYDGNDTTDIYFYAPGPATDYLWLASGVGRFTSVPVRQVFGVYTPIPGDFDCDGTTDIYFYARGAATDSLWIGKNSAFTPLATRQVLGTYTPIEGDEDGDGCDDIFFYGAGSTPESRWRGGPGAVFRVTETRQVFGSYLPVSGDYNGDGRTDILFYASGASRDYLWLASETGTFTDAPVRQIYGSYVPEAGDFDGDGRDDMHFYNPGLPADPLWWSGDLPLANVTAAINNL